MLLYFTAVSAIVPSLLLLWWFRSRDVNPEPVKVLLATFGLGVATVVPVLMVALPIGFWLESLGLEPAVRGCVEAFVTAAGPEEFFKYLVVVLYASRHKEFDEPMDGVVYGAVASLGFASLENVLYVAGGGMGVAVARAITAVPGHAFTGAIMGYYVGQAKFDPANRRAHLLKAYFVPFLLHGLYDAPLLALKQVNSAGGSEGGVAPWLVLTLVVLVIDAVFTLRVTGRLRDAQLHSRAQQWAQQSSAQVPTAAYAQTVPTPYGAPTGAPTGPGFGPAGANIGPSGPNIGPSGPNIGPLGPMLAAGARPPAAKPPSAAFGAFLLLVGIAFASLGGLVVLGMAVSAATGEVESDKVGEAIMGTVLIGVLPLALGLVCFALGVRKLARASDAKVQALATTYMQQPGYAPHAQPPAAQYPAGPAAPPAPWQGGPPNYR